MPPKQRYILSAITTEDFTQGAFQPDEFITLVRTTWGEPVTEPINEAVIDFHYILQWAVPPHITLGKLADAYYRVELRANPEVAANFALWYRSILPMHLRLAFASLANRATVYLEINATTTTNTILSYIDERFDRTSITDPTSRRRLPKAFQRLSDEIGDQRAKDLMDRVASETDPRRAIRLSLRALRYGTQNIQARKAYQELGSRYAELGNSRRACFYYTQALELDSQNSYVLFLRGELLYGLREYEQARNDLARALAIPLDQQLFPEEYARAQTYLETLRQH